MCRTNWIVIRSRFQNVSALIFRFVAATWAMVAVFAAHAQSPPKLLSVTPTDGDTNAAPRGSVVFVFDQDMERTPLLITVPPNIVGNYQFTPATVNTLFSGSWSADRRTLTFQPSSFIPLNTAVTWTLNPSNSPAPLKSVTGQPLATISGSFKIASSSGGSPSETCPPLTPAPGSYVLTKFVQYLQTSAADPIPSAANSATFVASVLSPGGGPAVTNGSLVFPDGTTKNFVAQLGGYRLLQSFTTEAALDAAFVAGSYTLHFGQTGQPERVITMAMPATPSVIPKIENFVEAQTIDATKDFTLRWNPYSPQGSNAVVRVVITDEFANRIFLAPNACVPRTLDPAATSVVIPANYLRPGFAYQGQLIFGENFYKSTTDVAGMTGNGFVQRATVFTLKAAGNAGGVASELCDLGTSTLGSYTVNKLFGHRQTSSTDVVPQPNNPAFFGTTIASPAFGPSVTNGSLTLPDGTKKAFTNQVGFYTLSAPLGSEAALETAYPAGNYTVRFNQTGQPERVIPMTMPATPATIPRITTYDAAQEIDPASDFTLQWNPFAPQGPGAFIRLIITDEFGKLIFMAPNPCVPRTLDPAATSIVIPTNHFRAGVNYQGLLVFGFNFYNSTNDVPQMVGYGLVQRSTTFTLKSKGAGSTGGNGGGGNTNTVAPAMFTSFRVLANGHPQLNLSGSGGKNYMIQRAGSLPASSWNSLGSVTMNASGTGIFEDIDTALKFPAFYRAVEN